jgi:quinoprotein glucose dehydrogenase
MRGGRIGWVMWLLLSVAPLSGCGRSGDANADSKAQPVAVADTSEATQWSAVGGDLRGQKYAPLADIGKHNLAQLKLAWRYDSGDFSKGTAEHGATALQVTPLMVDGTLYFCTPYNRVIALDAETGTKRWAYDPKVNLKDVYTPVCRGVAYWRDTQAETSAACSERIYTNTVDARLLAVDAKTGKPCADFGADGKGANLLDGLGEVRSAEVYSTSAPLVIGDRVLTGSFVRDGQRLDAPGGGVRAYDARSGELSWVFDPVPPDRPSISADDIRHGATQTRGTPNVWGLMSADAEHGLVYVPTGSASPDHYGGSERGQMDYYGASIVALDAASGAVRWYFQTVHHDVWDYDVGAQPLLFEHKTASGAKVPALIASTKLGHVFVLNRLTGDPLFPVEERPVPQTTVPGEISSATQPFPTLPPPLHDAKLDHDSVWGLTFWDKRKCREQFDTLDNDGMFTPPSLKGALEYPGLGGGINWGGASFDPVHGRMVVNMQAVPFVIKLVPRAEYEAQRPRIANEGAQEKQTGKDAAGGAADKNELVALNPQEGTPYVAVREPLLSPLMTPCIKPPWGKLVAIDIASGAVLWQKPLGTLHGLAPLIGGSLHYGTPNSAGSMQTASGLVFIAAAMDRYFRAIDADTGEELWRYELPYAGNATPLSYRVKPGGKQFVVIAAGGHGPLGTTPGDAIVAFALDDRK